MRRTILHVLVICTVLACAFMLAACGQSGTPQSASSASGSAPAGNASSSSFAGTAVNDKPAASSGSSASSSGAEQKKSSSESAESQRQSKSSDTDAAEDAVVVIDAGHQREGNSAQEPIGPGASETKAKVTGGTAGTTTGKPEFEVNLEVALKLQKALEGRHVKVYMTRTTHDVDISNSERAEFANEHNAAIFVRLHCDGVDGDSSVNGFMTLYPGANEFVSEEISEKSGAAAEMMHGSIVAAIGANDRGVIERNDLSGFNWCTVPSVLFEMGCMSNPEEDEKLASDEYQQQLADAMSDAIVAYLGK